MANRGTKSEEGRRGLLLWKVGNGEKETKLEKERSHQSSDT